MRIKLLLFLLLLTGGLVSAQDTIRTLIITEAHVGVPGRNFVEITNMGAAAVDLSQFEIGQDRENAFSANDNQRMMLPEKMLEPGESFFIAVVNDFGSVVYEEGLAPEGFGVGPVLTPVEMWDLADVQIHLTNITGELADPERDSVSTQDPISMYYGRQCVYLRQYFEGGDSVVIDQVMGVFDESYGDQGGLRNHAISDDGGWYDVAGYTAASRDAVLIRKFSVKEGNLEFVRGNDEANSEWIALDNISGMAYRMQPWTYKNHGDYNLDENTLQSAVADVDFANKTITVPWGTRRPDGVMKLMDKSPGVYWSYILSPVAEDSIFYGCKTGDKLAVVVCGNDADRDTFDIVVSDPANSDNFVVPVANYDPDGAFAGSIMSGNIAGWPRIIEVESGMDTLTGAGWIFNLGIPNATRIDTLLERLEKPSNAEWEIVPKDGNATRPDLIDGDVLKVTAEDGSEREYYIKVQIYEGSHDARLSSITWPDMTDPLLYQEFYGWKGDTIPNFTPNTFNYQIKLPPDQEMAPATIARTLQENSTVEVSRATNIASYKEEDRTTEYTVYAEDDTSIYTYKLEWQKEFVPDDIQPYPAEPFVSEYVKRYYFNADFLEICNPGNVELDLSDYMIVASSSTNPAEAIQTVGDWDSRYRKYVPGYKWVDSVSWALDSAILEEDLAINPMVAPGDVFCLGEFRNTGTWGYGQTGWTDSTQIGVVETDVQFYNVGFTSNPWGEEVEIGQVPIAQMESGEVQYIFKILNDSVKQGLKPATDPNDFDLIESIGMLDNSNVFFGYGSALDGDNFTTYVRKPEYVFPKAGIEESFGDTLGTETEWKRINRQTPENVGGWPEQWTLTPMLDYGKHYFIPTTTYISKVSSNFYKVSTGYQIEDIEGVVTGTLVSDFLSKIDKADEGQAFKVVSTSDGSELESGDEVSMNDTLIVTSASGEYTTKYVLDVSDEGLSSDALLTSTEYTVAVDEDPVSENDFVGAGTLSGFEYGTTLMDLMDNINVPAGAKVNILDENGLFVSIKRLNYDTVYVNATVNDRTMLHVVAEDMVTTIDYWLRPGGDSAIIVSDLLSVDQDTKLISLVPQGISVSSLFAKLIPSAGATMKVVDKSGLDRPTGIVRVDDKIVVTSASGESTNTYFLSFIGSTYTAYLTYLTSSVYEVDQFNLVINGILSETELSDFMDNVEPSLGGTVVILDKDGNEKTSGQLLVDDIVKVVSGSVETVYEVGELIPRVSVGTISADRISLYPNPTNGQINIAGLNVGEKIQVFDLMGTQIREIQVNSDMLRISLEDQPSGMYLIVVSDNDKLIGRYKAIRK